MNIIKRREYVSKLNKKVEKKKITIRLEKYRLTYGKAP